MEYEFIENVAEELGVKGDELQIIIKRLGIKTLQMGVPPSGARVATAVNSQEAMKLRNYYAEKAG